MTTFGTAPPRFTELAAGVARLLAPNPSMMTGPGTNTYLFGETAVAVVDPGPPIRSHVDEIIARASGPIRWILVTHTHPDHSPAAAMLAARTGAELLGRRAPGGAHQDDTFEPVRELADGEELVTDEFSLTAIHTPGHASNHLCYLHSATRWLVTGDHVIEGSTVVIDPPDGDMKAYIESLERVRELDPAALLPGHGDRIDNPGDVIDWIINHRLERETRVFVAVSAKPALSTTELVPLVYADVPASLYGLAERSLLAHLRKLEADGRIEQAEETWIATPRN